LDIFANGRTATNSSNLSEALKIMEEYYEDKK
jgi:hypothetical protein